MKNLSTILLLVVVFLISTFSTSFAQIPWTKDASNPVMSGGAVGTWNRHVFGSIVLYNPDSLRYETWFTASIGPPSWHPYRIGYATSIDGINWTQLDTAVLKPSPGMWDESTVVAPDVILENGTYKMWYIGRSPSDYRSKIGYATSPDGINWTKYANNPVMEPGTAGWEAGGPDHGYVMPVPGGGYKMWYSGSNANYSIVRIGYATSPDGITWTKADSVNPVLTSSFGQWDDAQVLAPRVLFINNIYHMWYSGLRASGNPRQTGWARSIDGIHWKKYNDPTTTSTLYSDSDPVLKPSPGQWDGNYAQAVTVIPEGDSLRMWYHGSRSPTGTYLWRIGHATAPLNTPTTILVPGDLPTIQAAIDSASDGNVVLVADGTYLENINFKGKAITVASHFYFDGDTSHISNTIIDGSSPSNPDSGSVVYFISGEDTTSVLYGFTITNGSGTNSFYTYGGVQYPFRGGGGIFCGNSGGRFVSNRIVNNTVTGDEPFGGGLATIDYGSDAWVILEKNTIINNTLNGGTQGAFGSGVGVCCNGKIVDNVISYNSCISTGYQSAGGGVHTDTESQYPRTVIIKGNKITHNYVQGKGTAATSNWAAYGGGIFNRQSKVLIMQNEISDNQISDVGNGIGTGGGIYMNLAASGSIINRNTISHNISECTDTNYGGGIGLGTCYGVSITNNIISGNYATQGGGIRVRDFNSEIMNNTIVNNTASTYGGGLFFNNSNPIVINNILWDNQAAYNAGIYPSSLSRVRYSNVQGGYTGEGNKNADPLFADTILYELSSNSPCVGWGTDSVQISGTWYRAPSIDYDGDDRPNPVDNFVDMGAQESAFLIVGIVKENSDKLPIAFSLKQNYPNPFNPRTTIEFSIPKTETVTLKIYNLLGQEVSSLVSEKLTPGEYKYTWDASHFASGIYFYKIEAGKYIKTKKLILLK